MNDDVGEQELRAGDAVDARLVASPADADVPRVVRPRERTQVERQLGAASCWNTPAFFASLEKPVDGAIGVTRMTSLVCERYHVALRSAFSPQKPTSKPPSSSFVRSGLSDDRRLGDGREQDRRGRSASA